MLSLHLSPIFKARNITKPYTFLIKAGFSSHSATTILNSKPKVVSLAHIEKLCTILVCEPNDLLLWTPEKEHIYAENFPLLKLHTTDAPDDLKNTLATMPFKQLKEVTKVMVSGNKLEQ